MEAKGCEKVEHPHKRTKSRNGKAAGKIENKERKHTQAVTNITLIVYTSVCGVHMCTCMCVVLWCVIIVKLLVPAHKPFFLLILFFMLLYHS